MVVDALLDMLALEPGVGPIPAIDDRSSVGGRFGFGFVVVIVDGADVPVAVVAIGV